jgi:NAD(P)-dependent dehydrogenase (short-subunit alcohol dehydrogenase family)
MTFKLISVASKTALVTGRTHGIGYMLAEGLVKAVARVFISSHNAAAGSAAENKLSEFGEATAIAGDLSASSLAPSVLMNAIAPGSFPTKMMKVPLSEHGDEIRSKSGVNRIGTEDDAAALTTFLSARSSSHTTRATIPLDGGLATTMKVG